MDDANNPAIEYAHGGLSPALHGLLSTHPRYQVGSLRDCGNHAARSSTIVILRAEPRHSR